MEPLIALVGVTAVLQLAGRLGAGSLRHLPTDLRGGLAVMFLLTGGAHLVGLRGELVEMVPPWLPAPELLVTVTGFAELAGAVGLLWWRTATPAAAGLTLLMVLMFPANVYAATSGLATAWYDQLVPRTVMQLVFLAASSTVLVDGWRRYVDVPRRWLAPAALRATTSPVRRWERTTSV